jgi:hypothetical protein
MQVWDYIIQPACSNFGITPVRSDQIATPGEITDQVFRHLRDDDVVIADVTGGNPNVMYELGLRHTVDKPTIQIGETERLPFDIHAIRTIRFQRTETGLVEAREALRAAIHVALDRGSDSLTATRLWSRVPIDQAEAGTSAEAPGETQPTEPPGFLELLAESEIALPQVAEKLTETGEWGRRITEVIERSAEDLDRSDATGAGASGRLAVAIRLAKELEEPAGELERISQELESLLQRVGPGISYIIGRFEEEPESLQQASEFSEGVQTAAQGMRELASAMATAEQQLSVLESAARQLRPPVRRVRSALRKIGEGADVIGVWESRLRVIAA